MQLLQHCRLFLPAAAAADDDDDDFVDCFAGGGRIACSTHESHWHW
jgi:hypothetical protein